MSGLAATLARAFGNVEQMAQLYDPDILWTLPASLGPLAGPYSGRNEVTAFNRMIDGAYDAASVSVTILDDIEQGEVSVARFVYRANMLPSGDPYEGEYLLLVRSRAGRITEVHERLDTLAVFRARAAAGQGALFD